jgi:ribosomal protein L37AE/L43A
MPKARKCPVCPTQTLQPTSTNRLWECSKCDSIFLKKRFHPLMILGQRPH